MKRSLLEIINEVILESGQFQLDSIVPEMDLRTDLGLDSMQLALLTVLIEDEYGIDIFEDGLVSNVADILNKING
jgi:acyl carrier protein